MTDPTEVKLHFLDYWRVVKARWGILTLTFLLVMVTAGITVTFLPREYFSKAVIEVKADESRPIDIQTGQGGYRMGSDTSRLAPTQFQILQSRQILDKVVENLGLREKWAKGGPTLLPEQAYNKLIRMMQMREVRNTDLIEIGVYSTDREEAARIANLIAVVYQDTRRNDQSAMVQHGLSQLQEQVEEQRKKVEQASAERAKIAIAQDIVDPDPESMGVGAGDIESQTVRATEQQATEAKMKTAELQTQLSQIQKLKPADLPVILPMLNISDPTVLKVLPLYQDAIAEEARLLNSGLGPNHPKIKSLRAQKDVYAGQLSEQLEAVRRSLGTKLAIAQSTQAALEEKLDQSRQFFTKRKNQTSDYIDAKSRYIQAKKLLNDNEQLVSQERLRMGLTPITAIIRDKAEVSLSPAKPNVPLYLALAAFVGIGLGLGLAFFLEYLDTSVKTVEDVEKFLGVPVLAVIPKNVGILMHQAVDTPEAETYRILRTNIEFSRKSPNANTITIVSGGPGEGKSTTLCNLAYTCAKGGYNVLLVDADLRRPSQHRLFNVENNFGLTNYLTGNIPFEEIVRTTAIDNLSFVPSGVLPRDSVGILNSQRMIDLIGKAKRRYDLVFFDSPPILGVSDSSVIASEMDLCIMVVEHRRFPRSMLQRVKHGVIHVGGNLLGVVLNKVAAHSEAAGYYTNYDYYAPQPEEKPRNSAAAAKIAPAPRSVPTGEQY
jgi:succinoglycan biosynthesis transport protein ExoP